MSNLFHTELRAYILKNIRELWKSFSNVSREYKLVFELYLEDSYSFNIKNLKHTLFQIYNVNKLGFIYQIFYDLRII